MRRNIKNRRSFSIIHKYQIKFSFFTALTVFLCTLAYPIIISAYIDGLMDLLGDPNLKNSFLQQSRYLNWSLIGLEVFVVLITFYLTIRYTFHTAGPILKTIKVLENMSNGIPVEKIQFRKGDNFPELADAVNEFIISQGKYEESIRTNLEQAIANVARVNEREMDQEERKKLIKESLDSLREIGNMMVK